MDQLLQALRNLPAPTIWAVITFVTGATLTSIAYHLVLRRYGPLQSKVLQGLAEANDKLVETQKAHVEMMERTLLMQKEHYEAELKEAKEEWQACRKELHAKREEWNAEKNTTKVSTREWKSLWGGRNDQRVTCT
jgi:cell shape-determining protein MreC